MNANTTMKAVRIHQYGGPEVLTYEDASRPEPEAGEVLIQVHAAGVNPIDWKVREGYLKGVVDYQLPFIPGWDIAGVVASVGGSGGRFKVGDAVYGSSNVMRGGGYAEYVAIPESGLAPKPATLDFIQAAAVPIGALTAWQSLFEIGGLTAGQTVLIHAAAGGVGTFAVQFARARGASVIGTASTRNIAFLQGLGVNQAIDYTTARFEDTAREVDVVFDLIGGETQERSWKTLKKGGILVSTVHSGGPPGEMEKVAEAHGVRAVVMSAQPSAVQLAEIGDLIDAAKAKVVLETALPLSQARQAQEQSQAGRTRGKIVLKVAA